MDLTPHGHFSFYMRGWRHGASLQMKDIRSTTHREYGPSYLQGYEDGAKARSETARKAATKFGYHPTSLKDII